MDVHGLPPPPTPVPVVGLALILLLSPLRFLPPSASRSLSRSPKPSLRTKPIKSSFCNSNTHSLSQLQSSLQHIPKHSTHNMQEKLTSSWSASQIGAQSEATNHTRHPPHLDLGVTHLLITVPARTRSVTKLDKSGFVGSVSPARPRVTIACASPPPSCGARSIGRAKSTRCGKREMVGRRAAENTHQSSSSKRKEGRGPYGRPS